MKMKLDEARSQIQNAVLSGDMEDGVLEVFDHLLELVEAADTYLHRDMHKGYGEINQAMKELK